MMDNKTLNLKFHGRRKINSSKRKTYFIIGTIEILIGGFGLIKTGFETDTFFMLFLIFSIAGITNMIYGLVGKVPVKEKNYIAVTGEEIVYKNSFRKPQTIKLNDLLDIRIEASKAEFVMNDQRVKYYGFSMFQEEEIAGICSEFERVKEKLII